MDPCSHTHDDVPSGRVASTRGGAVVRGGRIPVHPDIAHTMAIVESHKRECVAIDKLHEKMHRRASSTGAHSDTRDKIRRAPDTIHDRASLNPLLRDMLRQ